MLIKDRPNEGICFAWFPKRVPGGLVWLDFVRYRRHANWGWGSGGWTEYEQWPSPRRDDNEGEQCDDAERLPQTDNERQAMGMYE